MPGITFTEQDIASSADLAAGWYPVDVKAMTEAPGKNDPSSTTWTTVLSINDGPFKGREVRTYFSTKMPQLSYRYLKCFGVEPKAGVTIPIEDTVGRQVQAYIVMDPTSGFPNVKDFKPIGR